MIESEVHICEDGSVRYPAIETVMTQKEIANVEMIVKNIEDGRSKEIPASSLYYCNQTFMAAKYAADSCLSAISQVIDEDCPE